jgi:hypothetical protein
MKEEALLYWQGRCPPIWQMAFIMIRREHNLGCFEG